LGQIGSRFPVQDYTSRENNDDNNNLGSRDSYIHDGASDEVRSNGSQQIDGGREGDRISDIDSEAATEGSLDRDEGSNTIVSCFAVIDFDFLILESSVFFLLFLTFIIIFALSCKFYR